MTGQTLGAEDILCGLILFVILLALSITDLRRGILPNELNFLFGLFGIFQSVIIGRPAPLDALLGSLACTAVLLGIAAEFRRTRGIDGLGAGDLKFGMAAGLCIGWQSVPWMLLVASALALAFVLVRTIWRQRLDRFERTAFGPFLSVGVLASWVSAHAY
jgi:leader peptidase (prepilin peptidase)/N-methyltransferase